MKKSQGFTLIELVVVIIILGVLAVVAAPKFINLQGDARAATLKGLQAAIQGANSLVYSKSALKGVTGAATSQLNIGTTATPDNVPIVYGYVAATAVALESVLDAKVAVSTATAELQAAADWIISNESGFINIRQNGAPTANCNLTYTQATASSLPAYLIVATGC